MTCLGRQRGKETSRPNPLVLFHLRIPLPFVDELCTTQTIVGSLCKVIFIIEKYGVDELASLFTIIPVERGFKGVQNQLQVKDL